MSVPVTNLPVLSPETRAFVDQTVEEAKLAFRVFRETGTTTAQGTVGFVQRVPGEEKLITVNYPGPFNPDKEITATVVGFDGTVYLGKNGAGAGRYLKLFQQYADVTTISHVHSPHLGAWAQTHRSLPIRYVPVIRFKLFKELPVYIDRRQQEVDFILDRIQENPHTQAILEANGGSTVWGKKGLRELAEYILILEEGARLQILAESIGGSRDLGPGVWKQQWKMGGLYEQGLELGLIPPTDR
ncbi:hypothetical protein MYXO_00991 [Myxococcaceae bacterium]|nr:hypothetical protein MYXO_00991 [Myxococcaceae bacterium]